MLMVGGTCPPTALNQKYKEIKMSVKQDLLRYLHEGFGDKNVVSAQTTGALDTTNMPRGTICVIDYLGNATDHDVYIWSDGVTAGTEAWIRIHDETA